MKANLSEIITLKNLHEVKEYIESQLQTIQSPIVKKVKVYSIYTVTGTEKRPYGWDHGHYDSTLFTAQVYGWKKVSKEVYDSHEDNKKVTVKKVQDSLYEDYQNANKETIIGMKNYIRVLESIKEEILELTKELISLRMEYDVYKLQVVSQWCSEVFTKYSDELGKIESSLVLERMINGQDKEKFVRELEILTGRIEEREKQIEKDKEKARALKEKLSKINEFFEGLE